MEELLPIVLGLAIGGLSGRVGRAPRVRALRAWTWVAAVLAGVAVSVVGGELAGSAWSPILDGVTALAGFRAGVFIAQRLSRQTAPDAARVAHAPR